MVPQHVDRLPFAMVLSISWKIALFHQNSTTFRRIVKQGTKLNASPQLEDKNRVQKTWNYLIQLDALFPHISLFGLSICRLPCVSNARLRACCCAAAQKDKWHASSACLMSPFVSFFTRFFDTQCRNDS